MVMDGRGMALEDDIIWVECVLSRDPDAGDCFRHKPFSPSCWHEMDGLGRVGIIATTGSMPRASSVFDALHSFDLIPDDIDTVICMGVSPIVDIGTRPRYRAYDIGDDVSVIYRNLSEGASDAVRQVLPALLECDPVLPTEAVQRRNRGGSGSSKGAAVSGLSMLQGLILVDTDYMGNLDDHHLMQGGRTFLSREGYFLRWFMDETAKQADMGIARDESSVYDIVEGKDIAAWVNDVCGVDGFVEPEEFRSFEEAFLKGTSMTVKERELIAAGVPGVWAKARAIADITKVFLCYLNILSESGMASRRLSPAELLDELRELGMDNAMNAVVEKGLSAEDLLRGEMRDPQDESQQDSYKSLWSYAQRTSSFF